VSRPRLAQLVLLTACGLGLLTPRSLYAQNPAAAEALFEQARAAMAAGSYDIACARFRDSDKLDPAVGTRFNLADCEERRGRVATAWSLFRGVLSELAQDDDRRPIAEERARALEPRLAYLKMRPSPKTPPGLRVRIDGVELGEGSFGLALPMDPGAHELVLIPPEGGAGEHSSFALREGEHRDLPIRLSAAEGPSASAPPVADEEPLAEPFAARNPQQKWAYVAGSMGAAGVVLGAVTGIVTLNKKSTADANCSDRYRVCNQAGVDANESGKTFGALSVLGFGVGVVGLAAGTYLWLTAPAPPAKAAHPSIPVRQGVRLRPDIALAAGAGFLSLAGRF
jgi:hypothetical protein